MLMWGTYMEKDIVWMYGKSSYIYLYVRILQYVEYGCYANKMSSLYKIFTTCLRLFFIFLVHILCPLWKIRNYFSGLCSGSIKCQLRVFHLIK